jgi:hypothetical protein
MNTKQLDYPLLKDVYQERAQGTVNRRLPHWAGFGVVAAIIFLFSLIGGNLANPVTLTSGAAAVVAVAIVLFLRTGLNSFDEIWERNIAEFSTALNGPSILQHIEKELEYDTLQYPHVVFTPNYMITFKTFGDIFYVRDIDLLEVVVIEPVGRQKVWANTRYYLNCISGPRHAYLSDNENHIREIFLEIRRRHPDVLLSESADAYFFGNDKTPS